MMFLKYYAIRVKFVATAVLLLSILGGCGPRVKKQRPLTYQCQQEQNGVEVAVEMLTKSQMKELFGVDFLNYGFVPLSLTINNKTSDALLLRGQSIHLPLEEPYRVAEAAHYSTLSTTLLTTYLSVLFFWPAVLPSLGGGYYMSRTNAAITHSVCEHGLADDDSLDVLPYEQATKVVFVPVDSFTPQFRMHLFNVHEKSFIPFTIAFDMHATTSDSVNPMLEHAAQA
jgi:hypothetical protein